jgi:DNA sulfur modification protein DndD
MRIEKLELENFKSYEGKNMIDLATDPGKPIVILKGDNGAGKTSILEAINWCFYGFAAFGHKPNEAFERINEKAREKSEPMKVQISMIRGKENWNIVRTLSLRQGGDKDSPLSWMEKGPYVEVDGHERPGVEAIESVLPQNASQFFFFNGEEISVYTEQAHSDAVKRAIRTVLNLPMITNAVEDLQAVIDDIDRKHTKSMKVTQKGQKIVDRHEEVLDDIDRYKGALDKTQTKLDELDLEARKKEAFLLKSEEVKDKIDELTILRNELDKLKDEENRTDQALVEAIKQTPLVLLREQLDEAVKYFTDSEHMAVNNKIQAAEQEGSLQMLQRILDQSICLCKRDITDEVRQTIEDEIKRISEVIDTSEETNQVSAEVVVFQRSGMKLQGRADAIETNLVELMTTKARVRSDILSNEAEKLRLELSIGGAKEEEYSKTAQRLREILTELMPPLRKDAEELTKNLAKLIEERDKLSANIDKLQGKEAETEKYAMLKKRAREALAGLQDQKDTYIEIMREDVEKESTKVFKAVTNMPKLFTGILVGENFNLALLDKQGKPFKGHKGSEGQKEILAFSFMAGLAKASKSEAPFVMDSAFIRFDKWHKDNVISILHQLAEQVILLVIPKTEVTDADLNPLVPYTSKVIELQYDQTERRTILN